MKVLCDLGEVLRERRWRATSRVISGCGVEESVKGLIYRALYCTLKLPEVST